MRMNLVSSLICLPSSVKPYSGFVSSAIAHHRPLRINHNLRPVVVNHRPRPVYHPLIPLNLRHNLPLHFQRRQGDFNVYPNFDRLIL